MTNTTRKAGKQTADRDATTGWSDDERAAMKERAAEMRAASTRKSAADKAAAEEQDCLAKIAELPDGERVLAERVHALIKNAAPELAPKTWYGMPAYAKDGKLICFFQPAAKFKARYATLGFDANANLDDGDMWPTSYAITRLGESEEKLITELVTRAVG